MRRRLPFLMSRNVYKAPGPGYGCVIPIVVVILLVMFVLKRVFWMFF